MDSVFLVSCVSAGLYDSPERLQEVEKDADEKDPWVALHCIRMKHKFVVVAAGRMMEILNQHIIKVTSSNVAQYAHASGFRIIF